MCFFLVWLRSHGIIPLRATHVAASTKGSFLFMVESYSLEWTQYTVQCTFLNWTFQVSHLELLSIKLTVTGACVHCPASDIHIQVILRTSLPFLLSKYQRVECLWHRIGVRFIQKLMLGKLFIWKRKKKFFHTSYHQIDDEFFSGKRVRFF